MNLTPSELAVPERYKLLIGSIAPRPIALVSTISTGGAHNLAPFSFFTGVGSNPMTLLFCPANHDDGSEKDSLRNAKPISEGGTGQFVVNVVPEALVRSASAAAENLPPDNSEFPLANLTPAPCRVVTPPRVLESPVSFECRTILVHRTNPGAPSGGNIVIGEVVHVHILDALLDERGRISTAAMHLVGRMEGRQYCRSDDRFEVPLGKAALQQEGGSQMPRM